MENREEARKYFDRGVNFYERDCFNDAIREFTEAIRHFSKEACIYGNRGAAYGQLGRYSEAIADFEKALQLDPGNAEYIDNIAMTKRARGW